MKTSTTQVHEIVDQDEENELLDESADKTLQSSLCTGIYESANEALKSPLKDPQISSLENVTILRNSTVSDIVERGTVRNEGCGEEEQDRRVFTFSQIDSMADTFRRKIHFILVVSLMKSSQFTIVKIMHEDPSKNRNYLTTYFSPFLIKRVRYISVVSCYIWIPRILEPPSQSS